MGVCVPLKLYLPKQTTAPQKIGSRMYVPFNYSLLTPDRDDHIACKQIYSFFCNLDSLLKYLCHA